MKYCDCRILFWSLTAAALFALSSLIYATSLNPNANPPPVGGQAAGTGPNQTQGTGQASAGNSMQRRGLSQAKSGTLRVIPAKISQLNRPLPTAVTYNDIKKAYMNEKSEYEYALQTIKGYAQGCSDKAYTVQDQQAAGCNGSDSVDLCMEKLYKHCMNTPGSQSSAKSGFVKKAEQQLAASRELAKIAQAYADYIEMMLNRYGK